MRTIPDQGAPKVLAERDRVRDQALGFRASAWSDYVSILEAKDRPVLRGALFLTRGSKAAFEKLGTIMQGNLSAEDTLSQLKQWGTDHSRVVDAFATSGEAMGGWLRLTGLTLPTLAKLETQLTRADDALFAALGRSAEKA